MSVIFQFNRRTGERIFRATAGLTLAIWLLMSVAEICPPLHAWLHGGSIPDDDDCAVVAIALGHVDSGTCVVAQIVPMVSVEIVPIVEFSIFSPAIKNLPNERAPPLFCFAF